MLTYFERVLLLGGVPTIHLARTRLEYLPAAAALLVLGLGLGLTWLLVSRRGNLHELASGIQILLLGLTLLLLGLNLGPAANFCFLAFLFSVVAVFLLALFNFQGLGNRSLFELRLRPRQALAYGGTLALAVGAYALARALLPPPI